MIDYATLKILWWLLMGLLLLGFAIMGGHDTVTVWKHHRPSETTWADALSDLRAHLPACRWPPS
jgi:hypothetical protein